MKISDLNPYIRYSRVHLAHTHVIDFSICYDCRLFFMKNSSGYVLVNGIKYNFSNNDVLYFPPKTRYRFRFNHCDDFKIIVFDFDLINDFSHLSDSLGTATDKDFIPELSPDYTPLDELSYPILKSMPQLQASLLQCSDNFLKKSSFYKERSSALLKLCLLELMYQNSIDTPYSLLCEKVLAYIHENYSRISLTNEDIAEKFNYHPNHLSRIMKQETGKTLHNYLVYYRLRVAKNLLITTQYDIEKISWLTGFCSSSYFIKTFRAITGMTPNKYRKTQFHTEL